jgi:hypothetical protein
MYGESYTRVTQETDRPHARKSYYFVKFWQRVPKGVLCLTPLTQNLWLCGSGSNVQFAEIACLRPTTTTMRKNVTIGARVAARRGPLQPLKEYTQRQQRDRTYGTVGGSISEGMWVVIWDSMPPKHESARALRVEPDNASRCTPTPTQTSNAQRIVVRMPFHPPSQRCKFPVQLRRVRY